jgi:uncharacterized delta-60 repeat protein
LTNNNNTELSFSTGLFSPIFLYIGAKINYESIFNFCIFITLSFCQGELDPDWNTNGYYFHPIVTYDAKARACVQQSDNKIVAAGLVQLSSGNYDFAVARYLIDGSLDTSFVGGNGKINTDFYNRRDEASCVAIGANGNIIVAGFTTPSSTDIDFMVASYLPNGTLDTNFNGVGLYSLGSNNHEHAQVGLLSDGSMVIGGSYDVSNDNAFLLKLDQVGSIDSSFGTNGVVIFDIHGGDLVKDIAIDSIDNIFLAGVSNYNTGHIVKVDYSGLADSAFGTNGIVTLGAGEVGTGSIWFRSIVIDNNGKVVASGSRTESTQDLFTARFNADGSLDSSWNNTGYTTTSIGYQQSAYDIRQLNNGEIFVAGEYKGSSSIGFFKFFTAQYGTSITTNVFDIDNHYTSCNVFPNYTSRYINVNCNLNSSEISIYDLSGILVGIYNNEESIDLTSLSRGVYIVLIQNETGYESHRVVKY